MDSQKEFSKEKRMIFKSGPEAPGASAEVVKTQHEVRELGELEQIRVRRGELLEKSLTKEVSAKSPSELKAEAKEVNRTLKKLERLHRDRKMKGLKNLPSKNADEVLRRYFAWQGSATSIYKDLPEKYQKMVKNFDKRLNAAEKKFLAKLPPLHQNAFYHYKLVLYGDHMEKADVEELIGKINETGVKSLKGIMPHNEKFEKYADYVDILVLSHWQNKEAYRELLEKSLKPAKVEAKKEEAEAKVKVTAEEEAETMKSLRKTLNPKSPEGKVLAAVFAHMLNAKYVGLDKGITKMHGGSYEDHLKMEFGKRVRQMRRGVK